MSKSRKLYLVVRPTWNEAGRHAAPNGEERVPVRAFTNKKDADVYRRELETEFRRDYDVWTWFGETLREEEYEALKSKAVWLKLVPPDARGYGCWDLFQLPLSPEHRAELWSAVPNCKAYEVIETKLLD